MRLRSGALVANGGTFLGEAGLGAVACHDTLVIHLSVLHQHP